MRCLILILLLLMAEAVSAKGFRCGTRLVVTGDPVTRLTRACGLPERTFKAKIEAGDRGETVLMKVTQWVYPRRGKRDMIVSVHAGKVVWIERG